MPVFKIILNEIQEIISLSGNILVLGPCDENGTDAYRPLDMQVSYPIIVNLLPCVRRDKGHPQLSGYEIAHQRRIVALQNDVGPKAYRLAECVREPAQLLTRIQTDEGILFQILQPAALPSGQTMAGGTASRISSS